MVWNPFKPKPKPTPAPTPKPSPSIPVGFGSGGLQSKSPTFPTPTKPSPTVPTPKSGGSSGGGGSSKPVVIGKDSTGTYVAITPSGLQSVAPTNVLAKGTPINIADTTKNVQNYAQQVLIANELKEREKQLKEQKQFEDVFGSQSTPSSVFVKNIQEKTISNLQESQMSVPTPSEQYVARVSTSNIWNRGAVSPEVGTTAIAGIYQEKIEKKYLDDVAKANQNINREVQEDYNKDIAELQRRINEGEDYNKVKAEADALEKKWNDYANTKFKEFNKNWESTTGANLSDQAQKQITRYSKLFQISSGANIKNLAKDASSQLVSGGVFGAGMGLFSETRPVQALSKFGGAKAGLLGIGISAGTGLFQGVKDYAQLRKEGFSKEEARLLASGTGLTTFVRGQAGLAGFTAGAYAGGMTVNFAKGALTTKQQNLVNNIVKDNSRTYFEPKKGTVTESTLKTVEVANPSDKTAVDKLVNYAKEGRIVRQADLKIDTQGLSASERLALKIANIKAKVYTITDIKGNVIDQIAIGNVKTGRIGLGQSQSILSETQATAKGGEVRGVSRTGRFDTTKTIGERFTVAGQYKEPRLFEVDVSKVGSKGKVQYGTKDGKKYRLETSESKAISKARAQINEEGLWTRTDIKPIITRTKSAYLSERTGVTVEATARKGAPKLEVEQTPTGMKVTGKEGANLIDIKTSEIYKDIKGSIKNIESPNLVDFKVTRTPTKTMRKIEEPSLDILPSIKPSTPKPTPTPSDSSGSLLTMTAPKVESAYKGTGMYELTEQNLMFPSFTSGVQRGVSELIGSQVAVKPVTVPLFSNLINVREATPKQELKQVQALRELRMLELPKQDLRQAQGLRTLQTQPQAQRQMQLQSLRTLQTQPQAQRQQVTQSLFQQVRPVQARPLPFPPIGVPPLPFLGSIETGNAGQRQAQQSRTAGVSRYNPSLGAVLLRAPKKKVTQAEYERLSSTKATGLGLRQEIEIVSKKRRGLGII